MLQPRFPNSTASSPSTSVLHFRTAATGKTRPSSPTTCRTWSRNPARGSPPSSATLNASFDGNGEDTHYFFEWGIQGKPYEHATPNTDAGSPAVHTQVSESISGLTSDSAYHYRAVMTNPKGTSPGNEVECASANAVTALTTVPVSDLTSSSATLNGSWDGNGEDTHYFYEWGFATGSGFEHSTPSPAADGGSSVGIQAHPLVLTGLASDATYRYRIIASNSKGTSTGETLTFKTFKFPTVQYLQPTKEEPTSLQLNALVNPNEGGATTFHYEYGTTTAYGASTPRAPRSAPTRTSTKRAR